MNNRKTICIATKKGGAGKTTTAVNLACIWAREGHRVLLIDHDAQGNATTALGIRLSESDRSLHEAIVDMEGLPIVTVRDNLFLCPADIRLATIEQDLHSVKGRVFRLSQLLEPIRSQFDFIVIDCPPNHGVGTNSALVASDYVLIPTEATLFGVRGVVDMLDTLEVANVRASHPIELLGILVTRMRRTRDQASVIEQLRQRYPQHVLDTVIRESASVAASQLYCDDVAHYHLSSNGAADYLSLSKEILRKLKNE